MISHEDIEALSDTYAYWSEEEVSLETKDMVKEFARLSGQVVKPSLYASLIQEEFDEWRSSYLRDELEPQLKELADLIYVVYGYANAKGWNLDEAIYRVHVNNVGRMFQPDGTIKRRQDGKVMKNKDYPKVNLEDLV